jgi:hypothetical protein
MSTTIELPSGIRAARRNVAPGKVRFLVYSPGTGNAVEMSVEDTRILRDFALNLTVGGPGDHDEGDDE